MLKTMVLILFSLAAVSISAASVRLDEHVKHKDCMLQIHEYCNINDDACVADHVIRCATRFNVQAPNRCDGRCLQICIASCRNYYQRCRNLHSLSCISPHNQCVHSCVINCHCSEV